MTILYSGYDHLDPLFDPKQLEADPNFQEAVRTSHGRRPPTSQRVATGTARLQTGVGRMPTGFTPGSAIGTAVGGPGDSLKRPMTSMRGTGYKPQHNSGFDPFNDHSKGPAPSLTSKTEESYREHAGLTDAHNLDLTFAVLFNLANQYSANEMYTEALNTYQVITKNKDKMFSSNAGRLKVNMANIYFKMGQYTKAIKFYRMALDQTGLDLVTSYFALEDKDKMKKGFLKLLDCHLDIDDDEKYSASSDDHQGNLILEVIRNDSLRKFERQLRLDAERSILTAAKLISPVIEETFALGYNWSTLRMFEKKETKIASTAATNLSFLYFLQNDVDQAEKYAVMARDSNGYNEAALVNLGNCCFKNGDLEKAKEHFLAAIDIDASCVEALYNLGLTCKQLGHYEEALDNLLKHHAIVRNYPPCVYQIAHIYQLIGDNDQASEYLQLLGLVPTDPHILQRLGELFDAEGDKQQAYQYYFDSYRYFPSNLVVIDWLGSYFIEHQVG
ncbi:Intraflagellar transport protein 88-like protein [Armadillidium nasatum]|uniref:Intraflagellar transport protein 88-like protein n=1 Tax=Armadillidium nasatum TaxID=96803 RepID=A0A5N5TBS0_9CRUS|nr:Intraflagellar transport protein 88-like protein [Armadillidium nasatum]